MPLKGGESSMLSMKELTQKANYAIGQGSLVTDDDQVYRGYVITPDDDHGFTSTDEVDQYIASRSKAIFG